MNFTQINSVFLTLGMLSSCSSDKEHNVSRDFTALPIAQKSEPVITTLAPKSTGNTKTKVKRQKVDIVEWNGENKSFKNSDLTFVLFYADWCEHSRSMKSILKGVTSQKSRKIRIIFINADNFPELAEQHHVQAVPMTQIFNKKAEKLTEFTGLISQNHLDKILNRLEKIRQ